MEYADFLSYLRSSKERFFIEVEAKPDKMDGFIAWYNAAYSPIINSETDGVCILSEYVDKWSYELRIYLNDIENMPEHWLDRKYENRKYRSDEFAYRIDDNNLVRELFNCGFKIGYNNP